MCNIDKLSNKVYQFDGFSFYNCLEQPNYWCEHGHEEIQIALPQTNAEAWMRCESSLDKQCTRQIQVGETFLVSSNQPHALDWRQTAELTIFYLHPRFLASAIDDSIEEKQLAINDRFSLINDPLIREIGVIFRHLCSFDLASDRLYVENLANLLAVHLLRNYLNYNFKNIRCYQGLSPKKLNLILEYIETNLNQKITLSDLATVAGVGKFYFSRLFKSSTNLTPYNYVLQQRVERAKKLLKNSDMPICDIALECGFGNQSHLARHFRNRQKVTPMQYRKSEK
ncbi:conserved hypothetical protein [Hyella patelloides LEGE 07179]|uniref:HTH araC/xylS-type domain-containing protein n=1 Tax=Hyella patelloides LEGE 07179 TaxID=945734 RepID=A0A563VW85_9CYAN|nr:AraC family transcriptional regulator [Hyella patelloides]VEP15680.1 conserved hypothetical protein [Hyella patelloides LEGE 07179]